MNLELKQVSSTHKPYAIMIVYFLAISINPTFGQNIEDDSVKMIVFKDQVKIGENTEVLEKNGRYKRHFIIKTAGQKLEFKMECGNILKRPATIEIINPVYGKSILKLTKDSAHYNFNSRIINEAIQPNSILLDDYGSMLEKFMYIEYDKSKGGIQEFNRYRISENGRLISDKGQSKHRIYKDRNFPYKTW
jgi:hypothetical protein